MGNAPSHPEFGEGASIAGGLGEGPPPNPSETACSSGEASACQVRFVKPHCEGAYDIN